MFVNLKQNKRFPSEVRKANRDENLINDKAARKS